MKPMLTFRIACLLALLHGATFAPSAAAAARAQDARGETQLAEDQARLLRQLQRLRQTMEVLATRFEAEGRTHAAKLLRNGLVHLDRRGEDLGAKTIEELMNAATSALESGRSVQSVENQEAVVKGLEKLYSILTDRAGLEDLQKSLEDLAKIRTELNALADRESKLTEATSKLREQATSPEQKALQAALDAAAKEQRDLLQRNETRTRADAATPLDELQRAIERLARRQEVDTAVLQSWKPEERAPLEQSQSALQRAGEQALQAERLARAVAELREAARRVRAPETEPSAVQRDLERSAEREERHERASGDAAAKQSARALQQGAQAASSAASKEPRAREDAATAMENEARALEEAQRAAAREAQTARDAARAALPPPAQEPTAAGAAADAARKALDKADAARAAAEKAAEQAAAKRAASPAEADVAARDELKRTEEAEQSTSAALRAVQQGLEDSRRIPEAAADSQSSAARETREAAQKLNGMPEGATPAGTEANQALQRAASQQQAASEAAQRGDAQKAAAAAEEARRALEAAQASLGSAAEKAAAQRAQDPANQAMQAAQQDLARRAEEMRAAAERAGLPEENRRRADSALQGARDAMQKAGEELKQGRSSSGAQAQKDALQKLNEAREAAENGTARARPEDADEAQELAREQERIRQALLELAQRNQERKTSQPSPAMDQAGASAKQAQEELEEGDLAQGEQKTAETERKMREALKELGQEEEQYQKLRREELLFKIAEQVRATLEEHRAAMKDTLEIDQQRTAGAKATHTQRLRLRKIAKVEEGLGTRAGEISKALTAESSLVFAEAFDAAQRDLAQIARDMGEVGDYQSGDRVQGLQQDVEQSLVWLSEALAQEKERMRQEQQQSQQEQQQQQQQGQNRLVPDAAELKLLRRMEVDVLDSIDQLRRMHPEITAGKELDPVLLEDIARLAVRHQRLSNLFQKFRERLGLPDPGAKKENP